MKITPNTDEAVAFLHKWNPDGPWILTAISPAQAGITTKTFTKAQDSELHKWISSFNGTRNLYFTINNTSGEFNSKPKRTDITSIRTLHLDADPRAGEDIQEERTRILKSLQEFTPHPSLIVDSGAGFQAYWFLDTPIMLDGTETTANEAESYSIQLELLLSGDRTSNADRIMRIPGTVNLPNEVKKKKGRVPTLAKVIEWSGTTYPISIFSKAPIKIQQPIKLGSEQLPGGGENIKLSGNIEPIYIVDLEKRKINVSNDIKTLIVQGKDLDNPGRFPSRSEALWAVTCALVRAGATDEVIAGVLLNKSNGISESVLDKPRPERYTTKQIQDAREEIQDPVLRELNSKHAVISDIGGKCRIISESFDHALKRTKISYQSFTDFLNRYCNRKVQIGADSDGKPIMMAAGKWWVGNAQRRQYDTIVFSPGHEVPQAYNLWQGFACDAIPGDCSLFLEHVKKNLCQDNEEYNTYLVSWMARAVQHPDCTGEVAVVLRGEMGTGKSIFAKHFGSLFGRHFLQVSDPKHLVGSFNSHLRDTVVLFGDEAFFAGDKKHESVLKALVTEAHLTIEAKGVDIVASPNYTHIILASNSNWVVPAGSNERRYFALDVGADKMQDKKYFSAMQHQLDNGGKEALLYFLLNYNISTFEVRDVPKTAALQDQKVLSQSPEELWWFEKLEEGRLLYSQDSWERNVQKGELQNDYITFMTRMGIMRKASPTILGKFLGRVCPGGVPRSYQEMAKVRHQGQYGDEYTVTKRVYFYEIPTLKACRDHWDKHYGGPFNWGAEILKMEQFVEKDMFR
jgi:hypothetical protein